MQHLRLRKLYVCDARRRVLDYPSAVTPSTRHSRKRRCEKKLCPWTIKEGWKHTYLCSRACFKETCIFQ